MGRGSSSDLAKDALSQARAAIQAQQGGNLLRAQAETTKMFKVGAVVDARYSFDKQWYQAQIVGLKGDRFVIQWKFGTRPHLQAVGRRGNAGGKKDSDKAWVALPTWSQGFIKGESIKMTNGMHSEEDADGPASAERFNSVIRRAVDDAVNIEDLIKDSVDLRCVFFDYDLQGLGFKV
jgi:hypothetical protein